MTLGRQTNSSKSSLCLLGDLLDSAHIVHFQIRGDTAWSETTEFTEKRGAGISSQSKPFRDWGGESKASYPHGVQSPGQARARRPAPGPRSQSPGTAVRLPRLAPAPHQGPRTLTQVRRQADRVFLHPERSRHWNMKWSRGGVTRHRALGRCI